MATRRTSPSFLVLLLAVAAAAPPPVAAQVKAPSMVGEEDDAPEPPPPPRRARAEPEQPAVPLTPALSPRRAGGEGAISSAPRDLARAIVPVHTTWRGLLDAWTARRAALREQDPAREKTAEAALLDAKKDLDLENLVPFAVAEVRDAFRALRANLPAVALRHAELAARLAPDLPDAHLAVARTRLALAPSDPVPVLSALGDALAAAAREPHTTRALLGDVFTAVLAAAFAASCATLVLLFARRIRPLLHDFHHLPLVRAGAPIQAAFLGTAILGMPVALGLGPFAALAFATLAAWTYLEVRERVVATAALLVLIAVPALGGAAARATAWTGSVAETVHELEHGALSDAAAAEVLARADESGAPAPLLAALGRHYKRRGDLDRAQRLYEAAMRADDRAPELLVNVGNVRFLRGDLEGAKAAYLSAADRAGADVTTLAAAHYDLAKLYFRTSDLEKAQTARERSEKEDGDFLRRAVPEEEFSANHHVVDVPVPAEKVRALSGGAASGDAIEAWLRVGIAGALPRALWPWGGIAVVVLLWGVGLVMRRGRPSRPCDKCGRPACPRCAPVSGGLCGQCVNVFARKGVVDARDRLRKEAAVRRHRQVERLVTRVLAVVGPGAGQIWDGAAATGFALLFAVAFFAFVIAFWRGLVPPPYPSTYVLGGKLAVALPLGGAIYALAIRGAFRRTR